jgi:hypothetical protein
VEEEFGVGSGEYHGNLGFGSSRQGHKEDAFFGYVGVEL